MCERICEHGVRVVCVHAQHLCLRVRALVCVWICVGACAVMVSEFSGMLSVWELSRGMYPKAPMVEVGLLGPEPKVSNSPRRCFLPCRRAHKDSSARLPYRLPHPLRSPTRHQHDLCAGRPSMPTISFCSRCCEPSRQSFCRTPSRATSDRPQYAPSPRTSHRVWI